jgi:hypothetical protein
MRHAAITLFTAGAIAALPGVVYCQTAPVARADFTASTGWFRSNQRDLGERPGFYEGWPHTAFGALAGGFYWTDHVKSEVEVARTGEAEMYGFELLGLPGAPGLGASVVRRFTTTKVSAAQLYQFGRNARFHPFVGAGIDVDREREAYQRQAQTQLVHGPGGRVEVTVPVPALFTTTVSSHVRGFGTGGFKAYFSERGFFRTDLKIQVGERIEQVMWRVGLGVDF